MKPWTEKYKPSNTSQLVIDLSVVNKLKNLIKNKGVAMIHGPTGSGKTNAIETIASEGDYELIEMNSSDFRDTENVSRIIGSSLKQQSLFEKEKIILIDEVNGISGREDRGGLQTLAKLLGTNKHAVIMSAEDPWHTKLATVRKKSQLIEFKPIINDQLVSVLENICKEEKIKYNLEDLSKICRRVGGDVRAAINDLQINSCTGELTVSDNFEENERGKESNILRALQIVLKSSKWDNVQGVYDNIKEDHKEIMLWLDQNIPTEYSGEDLLRAYDSLSKADIFNRRIMRWQHWRYLVYIYQLLSSGVALAKTEGRKGFVPYKRSTRPLKIWMHNQKNFKRKTISEKLAGELHNSKRGFIKEDLPHLKIMARHGKLPDVKLSDEEVEWLSK